MEIEFETRWQSAGARPDVFAFLTARKLSGTDEMLAVLLLDQRYRWQTEMPLKVEDYLARLPDVGLCTEAKLQLVLSEYLLRQSHAQAPSVDEFVARFSDLADTLRSRLPTEATVASGNDEFDQTLVAEAPPELVGRYLLGRVLGKGSYGCVYLGFDGELQRPVAVKVPNPARFERHEDAGEFLSEARLAASLDHPHIVPVHDVGRTSDGAAYIVSKFIEGVTLGRKLRDGRLSFEECTRILIPVAQALHHAHERRLVHRDVKPGNILIEDRTGNPYVADFGLAVRGEEFPEEGLIAGTPAYMSPEQARGEGHRMDGRSDLFALGAIFYLMLTGRKAFSGATMNEILHQVVSADPTPPTALDSAVPRELERICLKSLAKKISDRYATGEELAEDLRQWQSDADPVSCPSTRAMVPHGLRAFDSSDADFFLGAVARNSHARRCAGKRTVLGSTSGRTRCRCHIQCGPDLRTLRLRQVVTDESRSAAPSEQQR